MDQRIIIAQLNIDHLRWQLASETDDARRQGLLRLLAEQEAKLAASGWAAGVSGDGVAAAGLTLQLHFSLEVSRARLGLVSASPE